MPAARSDIPHLKSILVWADSPDAAKESPQLRHRRLRDALAKAIEELEYAGRRETVAAWITGQLLASMVELPNGLWVTKHRELHANAMKQMREVFGEE